MIPGINPVPHFYVRGSKPIDHDYFMQWINDVFTANNYNMNSGAVGLSTRAGMKYPAYNDTSGAPIALSGGTRAPFFVKNITAAGNMWGRTWGSYYETIINNTIANRAIQHACPSQAKFNDIVSNNSAVILDNVNFDSSGPYPPAVSGVSRNGYTSNNFAGGMQPQNVAGIYFMVYWDFVESKAKLIKPFKMLGPFDFDLRGTWPIPLST